MSRTHILHHLCFSDMVRSVTVAATQFASVDLFVDLQCLRREPALCHAELRVVLPISFFERANQAYFNSVAVLDTDGTNLGVYRKAHIPDGPGYQEKFYFSPGDTGFRVFDTRVGRLGVAVCWDQWFPEAARAMVLQGAEMLLYPTAIGSEPRDPTCSSYAHWCRTMQGHAAANMFDPATQMGIGLDPGAIQAVSETLGVWGEDGCLESFHSSKLTRSQVQHDSGLIQACRNTQQWYENIKLEQQHLAAATPAGTSQAAIQRHVAVTLATWDAVWGEYLHPKWAEQRMRLHGAQKKVLERFFKKLEEEAAMVCQQQQGTRKQLVVFFGNAGIGTRGGWGANALLQASRKVVEKPNSGRPTDKLKCKVVTIDKFRTSKVSSAMNSPPPCEEELDRSKPTRPEAWKPRPGQVQHRLLRSAWSKRFEAPMRGLMWCPELDQATPGDLGKWVDRDCNAALNLQRAGERKWRHWSCVFRNTKQRLLPRARGTQQWASRSCETEHPRPKPSSL
ncbi:hypothetical protein QJQ45_004335 [Haematococcus lacustris]|nr:hypothetical protein QJQ45_004335 [Haematococcus lacustris]